MPRPGPPADLLDRFDQFWEAWPKRVNKADALAAFVHLRPTDELLDTMIAAITTQSAERDWPRDDYQFCPNPVTWLSKRRWEDEPRRPRDAHGRPYRMGLDAAMAFSRNRNRDTTEEPPA